MPATADAPPPVRRLSVNGADLSYVEQGVGAPVIFVRGAFVDHRYWEQQRQVVAAQQRFVAYDWRYHGTAPGLIKGSTTRWRSMPRIALTNAIVLCCIPASRQVFIPEATHLMSYQNPSAFNAALLRFLADH